MIQWGGSSNNKFKDCRWNFQKNHHLLIFGDFAEKVAFFATFGFCRVHLWLHRIVENRQSDPKNMQICQKVYVDNISYPQHVIMT